MKKMQKWALIVVLEVLSGTLMYFGGIKSTQKEDFWINPSDPNDWTQLTLDFKLHGQIYYPPNYRKNEKYPAMLLFHGLGRQLKDNDYFAKKIASRGMIGFSIDFRGHGKSGGTFPFEDPRHYNATFGDANGLYRYVRGRGDVNTSHIYSHGTSLGGGAALFLEITGLVNQTLVWYPAIAYYYGNIELYHYNQSINGSPLEGLILAGTRDECSRCSPAYVSKFMDNNPQMDLKWLEGASHADSEYFLECVDISISWIHEQGGIDEISWIQDIYYSGYLGIGLFISFGVLDSMILVNKLYFKRRKGQNKSV